MDTIVINPKDENELKFITELLVKLGVDSKILNEKEKEDLGMSILLKEVDRGNRVSEKEVFEKLKIT